MKTIDKSKSIYKKLNRHWLNLNSFDHGITFGLDDIIVTHEWFNIDLESKDFKNALMGVCVYLSDIYEDYNFEI